MHETLLRPHDVCNTPMQTIGDVAARLRDIEVRKEERRLKQIETSNRDKKRKRPEETSEDLPEDVAKKAKVNNPCSGKLEDQTGNLPPAPALEPGLSNGLDCTEPSTKDALRPKRTPHHPNATVPADSDAERYIVSKPFGEVRGHTSYLTFAMLVPSSPWSESARERVVDTVGNESGPANGLQNPASYDAQSFDGTSSGFDSLIAGIPEEELKRIFDAES
ncbi:hypothetical protein FRC06_000466 [Ceratobasidium sp. 370]|nr:hypothetical protein FRC06_000466 [Ceratobasidium sp. 370]